jgi:hypothetical protein
MFIAWCIKHFNYDTPVDIDLGTPQLWIQVQARYSCGYRLTRNYFCASKAAWSNSNKARDGKRQRQKQTIGLLYGN